MSNYPVASSLANKLHSIPRFTYELKEGTNQFAISEDYGWGLVMIVGTVVALAVLYIAIEVLVRTCMLCCRSGQKYQPVISKIIAVVLLAGCFGLVFAGFKMNGDFSSATDTALTAVDGSVKFYNLIKTDGLDLSTAGTSTGLTSLELAQATSAPVDIRDLAYDVSNRMDTLASEVNSYLSKLNDLDFTRHVKVPTSRADNLGMTLYAFSGWILLAVIMLLVIFCSINNKCGLFLLDMFIQFFVFVAWVVAAALFVLSVGASDFCQDSAANIIVAVPSNYAEVASYYVRCDDMYNNPLDTPLSRAADLLDGLVAYNGPYSRIARWNKTENTDDAVIAIVNRMDWMLNADKGVLFTSLQTLRGDLECPVLNGHLVDLSTAGCGGLLTAATFIFISNFAIAVVFYALRYMTTCGCCKKTRLTPQPMVSVNQVEYVRLMPITHHRSDYSEPLLPTYERVTQ